MTVNPPGGLSCGQTFAKTEEIACALEAGYKMHMHYDHKYVQQTNIKYVELKKTGRKCTKVFPGMSLGSDTMDNFFSPLIFTFLQIVYNQHTLREIINLILKLYSNTDIRA